MRFVNGSRFFALVEDDQTPPRYYDAEGRPWTGDPETVAYLRSRERVARVRDPRGEGYYKPLTERQIRVYLARATYRRVRP